MLELSSREHQCAEIRLASARSLMLSKAMSFHVDVVGQHNDHHHHHQYDMSSVMIRCRIRLCVICLRLLQDDDEEVRFTAQSILSTGYNSSSTSIDGFIGQVVEEVLMDRLSALLTHLLVASYHSRCISVMLEFDVLRMHLSSMMDLNAHDHANNSNSNIAALLDTPSSSKIFEAEADNLYIEQTKSGKVLSQAIATAVHRILEEDDDDDDDDRDEQCKKHAVLHWLEAFSSSVMSKVLRSLHLLVDRSAMKRSAPSPVTIEDSSSSSTVIKISIDASLLSYQPDIFRHLYLSLHFMSLLRRSSIASDLPAAIIGINAADGGAIIDLPSNSRKRLQDLMQRWWISLSELFQEERSRVCIDELHPWIRDLIEEICS